MDTLNHLVHSYSLSKDIVLTHFKVYLKTRPEPLYLLQQLNRILPCAPLLASTQFESKFCEFHYLFHPVSITQVHYAPDSFTAVRMFRDYIITASDDGAVKLFAYKNGILTLQTIFVCRQPHKRYISNMVVSDKILVVVWGSILAVWDISQYKDEQYVQNVSCFKLYYAVHQKGTDTQILVKDNADYLYIPIIKEKHYILAQTTTSILFISVDKQQIFTLFKLGGFEREDKQKIHWASYCQATKIVVFIFEIRHKFLIGLIDLNNLSQTPFYAMYEKQVVFQSDCCGGSICFSSILTQQSATYCKAEKITAEVAMIDAKGKSFAVSFRNMSCVLLYDMPHLYYREIKGRSDYTFVDLALRPKILDMQHIHIPALLKAQSPAFIVPNIIFTLSGRFLACYVKLESKRFDKSFIVFFDCNTGYPVNRCILYGTGSGIAMANMSINGQNYVVVTDAENTGKDILNHIYLGPRDTFVYLLAEDGSDVKACAHFPNGQEEDQMIFCDIQCHSERCYCTNACGQIMVIGPDQLSQDRIEKEIMPYEQFFMIELPAFYKMRYGLGEKEPEEKELPGKIDLKISPLLNAKTFRLAAVSARLFKVTVYALLYSGQKIDANIVENTAQIYGFQLVGIRLDILRTLLRTSLLVNSIPEAPQDYFFGFKFLRRSNFHHSSYYLETIMNICNYASPFTLVSCNNKAYDFTKERFGNFKNCQQSMHADFFDCIYAQNDFLTVNEPRSHIIGAKKCKQYGLLKCENYTEFVIDPNSLSYILHEGVNYRNKDQDDPYHVIIDEDLRIFQIANYNVFSGDEHYKHQFYHYKLKIVPDPNDSIDDLKEDSSSSEPEHAPAEVFIEGSDDDYSSYAYDESSTNAAANSRSSGTSSDSDGVSYSAMKQPYEMQESAMSSTAPTTTSAVYRKQGRKERQPLPFSCVYMCNYNYLQSANSCNTEQHNESLSCSCIVRAGDLVFVNGNLLEQTTNAYRDFFSAQVFNTFSQVRGKTPSGLYIVKSVYSRFVGHIQKVYMNKRFPNMQHIVTIYDIALAPFCGSVDAFLNSGANELHDPFFSKAFERYTLPNSPETYNAVNFVTILPLSHSCHEYCVHATGGIFPLRVLTRLAYFVSGEQRAVFNYYDYIPVPAPMSDGEVNDISFLLQREAMRYLDSYTLTYYGPGERKFADSDKLLRHKLINMSIYPVGDERIVPQNFYYSYRNNGLRAKETTRNPQISACVVSETNQIISRLLNNSCQRAEVIQQFELFSKDCLDGTKRYNKYQSLVFPAWTAIIELFAKDEIQGLLSMADLHTYLAHFYPKILIRDVPAILIPGEIAIYQNMKIDLIRDNIAAVFEHSMSETRRCNIQQKASSRAYLGELTEADAVSIQQLLQTQDLEAITARRVYVGEYWYFLTELQVSAPEPPVYLDSSFTTDEQGRLVIYKSSAFAYSLFNRALLFFALARTLRYSAATYKSSQHIQNYFGSPVYIERYLEKIASPVWLNLVFQRVISGYYQSYLQLVNDVQVIAANSQIFNHGDGDVYIDQAITLRTDVLDEMNRLIAFLFHKEQKQLEECCKIEFEDDEQLSGSNSAEANATNSSEDGSIEEELDEAEDPDNLEQSEELEEQEQKPQATKKTKQKQATEDSKKATKQNKKWAPKKSKIEDSFVADDSEYTGYDYSGSSAASDVGKESSKVSSYDFDEESAYYEEELEDYSSAG